mgnify:CR=1 FL=1
MPDHDGSFDVARCREAVVSLSEWRRSVDALMAAQHLLITAQAVRISQLENWQNQILGAGRLGKVVWALAIVLIAGLSQLVTWVVQHFGGNHR